MYIGYDFKYCIVLCDVITPLNALSLDGKTYYKNISSQKTSITLNYSENPLKVVIAIFIFLNSLR